MSMLLVEFGNWLLVADGVARRGGGGEVTGTEQGPQ